MHLKSLTLRGFKSFASATALHFEPGITCVVGPNGSGKSNVVDAISWVLGEQGAKALRGGKMEDVIFAGTSGRPPLGRAEVTLTIDNHDGSLPIDYAEVSITRRLFRSGESEYEINGDSCRLLDIQELLSDSGIGREMHVIVGQGQLDSVLQSRPEDRRGFIEEAAGVLKHRKRKEKALRKLDSMQANLTRLTDLTSELRRQLKPLGKQAELARRAVSVQSDLRDARLRLLADDLVSLRSELEKEVADESVARQRRAEAESALEQARAREAELESALSEDSPRLGAAQQTWFRLAALQERFRGLAQLAHERIKFLTVEPDRLTSRDPDALDREAEAMWGQHDELSATLEADQERLSEAVEHRHVLERQAQEAEKALVAAVRAVADRREGLARLAGQVNVARSRSASASQESARLSASAQEARQRAVSLEFEFMRLQGEIDGLDAGEVDLDERHTVAATALEAANARVRELTDRERTAERQASEWRAREEALSLGLLRKDGAAAIASAEQELPGVVGPLASLITVEPGWETAIAAALGAVADGVAVADTDAVRAALAMLKAGDGGRAALVVATAEHRPIRTDRPVLPSGAGWALDVLTVPQDLEPTMACLLDQVAVVTDLEMALALARSAPMVKAVTPEGDICGPGWVVGGSASVPSTIEVQAAVEEAKARRAQAESEAVTFGAELTLALEHELVCREQVEVTIAQLNESDARLNAVMEKLAQLGSAARAATVEAEKFESARQVAEGTRSEGLEELLELEERLNAAESLAVDEDPSSAERDEVNAQASQARQSELEIRLTVRTTEERVRALAGRAESLQRSAEDERAALLRAAAQREARARGAVAARDVTSVAEVCLVQLDCSLGRAAEHRDELTHAKAAREAELTEVRTQTRSLATELERLTNAVHRDEVARAEQRMRIEQLETKSADDFAIDVETLITEYGPQNSVPPTPAEIEAAEEAGESTPLPLPYHRQTQEKRANRAEKDLQLLGKVNPLALEEFAALEERYKFLATQLEDVKATRRDLLTVVKDVDERIEEVFASAYHDTAREFEIVFSILFPGGEGRLVLTDPDNMLLTGIEVEARPPGKKVKRLSLLSGGERSLTAVALLVAIFRARPSPFYVMDEVEAALDDTNLGRLITLMKQLQDSSQLIIITHQKRTMEIADALYGVSMRGDGISQVIGQRLKTASEDEEEALAATMSG